MASHIGTYPLQQFFAAAFRGDAVTWPTTLYAAAFTTMPTKGDGTGAVEVSGNNYARVAIAAGHTNWGAPSTLGDFFTEQILLSVAALFPTPSGTQGPIVGFGLYDASSGGNFWGDYTVNSFSVPSGIPYEIPVGFAIQAGG